jgi:hypothetical protein
VISFMAVSSCPFGDFAPAPILPGVGGFFFSALQPALQAFEQVSFVHDGIFVWHGPSTQVKSHQPQATGG